MLLVGEVSVTPGVGFEDAIVKDITNSEIRKGIDQMQWIRCLSEQEWKGLPRRGRAGALTT